MNVLLCAGGGGVKYSRYISLFFMVFGGLMTIS